MHRSLVAAALAAAIAPWPDAAPAAQIVEAIAAPQFELTDRWGDRLRLSDYRGKIVVLHFWAKWCGSCRGDLQNFQALHERLAARGVVVLGLAYASGSREEVGAFADEVGVTFPILLCREEVRDQYDVATFPSNVIVDRQGMVRHVLQRRMDVEFWDRIFEEMLDERP